MKVINYFDEATDDRIEGAVIEAKRMELDPDANHVWAEFCIWRSQAAYDAGKAPFKRERLLIEDVAAHDEDEISEPNAEQRTMGLSHVTRRVTVPARLDYSQHFGHERLRMADQTPATAAEEWAANNAPWVAW